MKAVAHRNVLLPVLITIVVVAWALLWWAEQSEHVSFLHAHGGSAAHGHHNGAHPLAFALLFVLGWLVMTIAMMLPTSLPLIEIFRRLTRNRSNRTLLVWLLIAGYLLAWAAFGLIAYALISVLGQLGSSWSWAIAGSWGFAAALFLIAGLFQFSALKYRCLDKCRSPLSFVTQRWRGKSNRLHSFLLGLDHGVFCVGCCWALMLLMFAVSTANVVWMLVLGLIMAVEKNVPWGRRLSAPLGVVLIGAGLSLTVLMLIA